MTAARPGAGAVPLVGAGLAPYSPPGRSLADRIGPPTGPVLTTPLTIPLVRPSWAGSAWVPAISAVVFAGLLVLMSLVVCALYGTGAAG